MRIAQLIQNSYGLIESLRGRYKLLLYGPLFFFVFALAPVWWWSTEWIASSLGLMYDTPLNGHPSEFAFVLAILGTGLIVVLAAGVLSSLLVAAYLRFGRGWSWPTIWRLLFESQAPDHWLKPGRQRKVLR